MWCGLFGRRGFECALLDEADVCWQGRQGLQGYDQKSFVQVSDQLDTEAKIGVCACVCRRVAEWTVCVCVCVCITRWQADRIIEAHTHTYTQGTLQASVLTKKIVLKLHLHSFQIGSLE